MIYRYVLMTMLVTFGAGLSFAQQAISPKAVYLNAANGKGGIRLHWTPADTSSFQAGLNGGYSLERFKVSQDGQDIDTVQSTIVTLGSEIDGRGFIDYIEILPDAEMTAYQFDDGFIKSDHNYIYKVMAAHAGGRFSEISEPLLVRVK